MRSEKTETTTVVRRRVFGGGSSAFAFLALVLAPKCPLCIAALLSGLGLGAGVAGSIAPLLRPLAFALGGLALVWLARVEWRARRARERGESARISACCQISQK